MKHLLSLILCSFFALFGFIAWVAVQIEPDHFTSVPKAPAAPASIKSVESDDLVAAVAANPATLTGASIHRELAGLAV